MAIAERIAALARFAVYARAVDTYEAVRRFRAFRQRCDIAAYWEKDTRRAEQRSCA